MPIPWNDDFEQVLQDVLPPLAGRPLEAEASLPEAGLDSLATIEVLMRLEEIYDTTLPDEALTSHTFATPAALWGALSAAREGSAAEPQQQPTP
jgi:acyl carrier protein